jgi:hypothetical protein
LHNNREASTALLVSARPASRRQAKDFATNH